MIPLLLLYNCVCILSCSVMSDSLQPHGLEPTKLHLSMGFSRQEYWSRLSCPPPRDLPNPRLEPKSPALAGGFIIAEPSKKPLSPSIDMSYANTCEDIFTFPE